MNVEWGTVVVIDFFFGGIAVGTFLFSVFYEFFYRKKEHQKEAVRLAAYISPLSMCIALIFLLFHLGQPVKAFWAVIYFNITSAVAWGALFQTFFLTGIILYALMIYAESGPTNPLIRLPGFFNNPKLRRKVGWFGVPNALIVGINHGFLLLTFESRPLWSNAATVLMAIVGVVTSGLALIFLLLAIKKRLRKEISLSGVSTLIWARIILIGALVAQSFNILLWIISLMSGPQEGYNAILNFMTQHYITFWGFSIILGLAVPIYIGIRDLLQQKESGELVFRIPAFSLALILIGAFFLRYSIIMAGQFK